MAVVIKTFATPGGKYVYDRETNKILSVTDSEFTSFTRIENGNTNEADALVLKRYQNQGYCTVSKLEEIRHPATTLMEYRLNSQINQLTIQVCTSCNLRCLYCTYGGGYEHQRIHSNKVMPIETMKKCVDFLMEHSRDLPEVTCGYYGGESLLEVNNIKECVAYIKENYKDRAIRHILTTNGTLFNDDIITFLQENEFDVMISFDGPKELHDINRVYPDGRGSFDDIMNNVEYIRDNYPVFFKKISFISVIAPGIDYACVNDFFTASDIMETKSIMLTTVNPYSAKESINYDDLYSLTYNYQHMKVLLANMGIYSNRKTSKLFNIGMNRIKRFYDDMAKVSPLLKGAHPSGPCMPGGMRPFVTVDGTIYPCERVSEESDVMQIGHINTGFDLAKAETLLNVGKLTEEECKSCWNFRNCMLCCAASDGGDSLSRVLRLQQCQNSMNNTIDILTTICLLMENDCDMSSV